jgi:hypothetical protein
VAKISTGCHHAADASHDQVGYVVCGVVRAAARDGQCIYQIESEADQIAKCLIHRQDAAGQSASMMSCGGAVIVVASRLVVPYRACIAAITCGASPPSMTSFGVRMVPLPDKEL